MKNEIFDKKKRKKKEMASGAGNNVRIVQSQNKIQSQIKKKKLTSNTIDVCT